VSLNIMEWLDWKLISVVGIGIEGELRLKTRLVHLPKALYNAQAAFDPRILATFCWFATE
jgi:hypothetical protein